jgi:Fe-S-cluster containining protein
MIDEMMPISLTNTLAMVLKDESQDSRQQVGELLLLFLEGFQQRSAEHPHEDPAQIAARLQRGVDLRLQSGQRASPEAHRIACTKGCSHCCYIRVSISDVEAVRLLQITRARSIDLDVARLAKQAASNDEHDWLTLSYEDRRCVFLGTDGTCQVYDARPIACRKYFVIDSPTYCDTRSNATGHVPIWFDTPTEIVATAVATHYGLNSLPRQLLTAIAKQSKGGDERETSTKET